MRSVPGDSTVLLHACEVRGKTFCALRDSGQTGAVWPGAGSVPIAPMIDIRLPAHCWGRLAIDVCMQWHV
jgi:hypothetical protein